MINFGPNIEEVHHLLYSQAICASIASSEPMLGTEHPRFSPGQLSSGALVEPLNFQQKLGYIYEDAVAKCIAQSSNLDLLARNLQIITPEKRTLGELDFVLFDRSSQEHIHLEIAIKFYLVEQRGTLGFQFPGPDKRDNYQRKLEKLVSHQLKLTENPHTRALLESQLGIREIRPQQLVHGIFFDHIHATERPLPEAASPKVRRRSWLHLHELLATEPNTKHFQLVHKALWPCEFTNDPELRNALPSISKQELCELAQQRCTMVLHPGINTPIFVAPDDW